jgi:tetratricopeptide (TPR) repeat protein
MMGMKRVIASVMLLLVFGLPGAAFSQVRWLKPYEDGVKAFHAGNWQKAIGLIENAVRLDPRQSARKRTEGVYPDEEYFPYYYLGIAHAKLGNVEQANRNLAEALNQGGMRPAMIDEVKRYQKELASRPEPDPGLRRGGGPRPEPDPGLRRGGGTPPEPDPGLRRGGGPPPEPDPGVRRGGGPPPEPDPGLRRGGGPPPLDPQFVQLENQARAELDQRRFSDALEHFDALRSRFPVEFGARSLGIARASAAQGLAREWAAAGRQLLADGSLSEAQKKFEAAETLVSGTGVDGVTEIQRRRADYTARRTSALRNQSQKRLKQAVQDYQAAAAADPQAAKAEGLDARIRALEAEMNAPPPSSESPKVPMLAAGADKLHDAIVEYLQGNLPQMITLLELSAGDSKGVDRGILVDLHAFLGVAYAEQSIAARKEADQQDLRKKALDQFRLALDLDPNYQLSQRLVSPKIQDLMKAAREK